MAASFCSAAEDEDGGGLLMFLPLSLPLPFFPLFWEVPGCALTGIPVRGTSFPVEAFLGGAAVAALFGGAVFPWAADFDFFAFFGN